MDFDGPHFSPDLLTPDGRLARLHKGGKHKANALAKEQMQQSSRDAAKARRMSMRTARRERRQARRDSERIATAQEEAAARLAEAQQNSDAASRTQVIEDEDALRRAARSRRGTGYGMSSSRAMSNYGLGGGSSRLG